MDDDADKLEINRRGYNTTDSRWYLALICAVASLGGFLFGFDTAVISGTIGGVQELFNLTDLQVGSFTGSALVGCIFGALGAGWLGDKCGRKLSLLAAALLFFVSALGSTIPPTYSILLPARFIGGLGIGIASVLAPMYISEFSPPKLRGRLVALYQLAIVIGILIAYFSNWRIQCYASRNAAETIADASFLNYVLVEQPWRGMFGAEMIPAVLFFFLLLIVPESPRWLVKVNRELEARAILNRLIGSQEAQTELGEIQKSLQVKRFGLSELFQPGLRKALLIGVMLSVFGQMSGVNIVVYYGPKIIKQAGFAIESALQFQVMLGIINLIFTVIALFIIDRFGRRPLLIGGMAVVAMTMLIAGVIQTVFEKPGMFIVVALGVYMACMALSICAVIWVITPEIYPNRIRARACSVAVFANWSTNAFSAKFFPWYVASFGMAAGYFTFGIVCTIATLFFFKFVPETKAKTLEEIEDIWIPNPKSVQH